MRRLLTGLAALSLSVAIVVPVLAFGGFLDQATSRYPVIDGTRLDSCLLCHTTAQNPGPLDPYGMDLMANGNDLAAIENLDSDGDGFVNLVEIQALTFPGDVTDFPQDDDDDDDGDDDGDGDGDGPIVVLGRGELGTPSDVTSLAVAAVTGTAAGAATRAGYGDRALVGWIDNLVESWDRVWLDGSVTREFNEVTAIMVDAAGEPAGTGVRLDDEEDDNDVDPDEELGLAYGRNRFLATWADSGGSLVRRVVRDGTGEPLGGASVIGPDGADSTVTFDAGLGSFLVAVTSPGAVAVHRVDRSGAIVGRVVPSQPLLDDALTIAGLDVSRAFALGDGGAGEVLIAGTGNPRAPDLAPLAALLESGDLAGISDPYAASRAAELQAAAAFGAELPGMVAWRSGNRAWTAPLEADGSLADGVTRLRGADVGAIGVAPLADGVFLVVWTDAGGAAVMGVVRDADGGATSEPFELQEDGESVDPGVLAVTPLAEGVLVVYVTGGDAPVVRTVVVGPQ